MKPINRKIRKLKNNPKLFFKDFLKNKKTKLINNFYKIAPKKYSKNKKFTIVHFFIYSAELLCWVPYM